MSPKEKAKELVYKFYPSVQWKLGQEDCLDRAKQCALIAVDEMIKQQKFQAENMIWSCVEYWEEIKQEIEKL